MISEKELSAIEDQLAHERVLVTKYNAYSQMCSDQALKQQCTSIAQKHQCHYDKLMGFLNG